MIKKFTIAILLIVFCLLLLFSLSLFISSFVFHWFFKLICLDSLLLFFCVFSLYTFIYLFIYLFIWLCQVLIAVRRILVAAWGIFIVVCGIFSVAAFRIFSCGKRTLRCGMWDLVPWPGIESGPPALGMQILSHWNTREVPCVFSICIFCYHRACLNIVITVYFKL